ncbi:MAG: PQQ-binding-like beta-propeller repeat protein [Alphaproteobacteria bacterium]|nr:PQQ-binding-like beta-propeller repeat protein [Alphaproteobacteria bacterium]
MKKIIVLLLCCTVLGACTDDKKYAPHEGRLTVFEATTPQKATGDVKIDSATTADDWTQSLYNAQNKLPHLKANLDAKKEWRTRAGEAIGSARQLPTLVVFDDGIYVLDGTYQLNKLNPETGIQVWRKSLADGKVGTALIGQKDTLFAVSSDGLVTAIDKEGNELWKKDFAVAMRAAPIADSKALYLITTHNRFIVLNQKDGSEIWGYQTSKPQTQLTSMAPPAKGNGVLVVPFSTGEVMGFDADSGLILWIQMMVGNRPRDLMEIPQIAAAPVIDGNVVYLSGNANLTGAYDLKTGASKWVAAIGSRHTPVVSGNTLFLLTTQDKLVALDKTSGKIFWEQDQKPFKNSIWQGLMIVNDQLALYDNNNIVLFDPKTGDKIKTYEFDMQTTPIVVKNHFITMDNKTRVTWYQ